MDPIQFYYNDTKREVSYNVCSLSIETKQNLKDNLIAGELKCLIFSARNARFKRTFWLYIAALILKNWFDPVFPYTRAPINLNALTNKNLLSVVLPIQFCK